MAILYALVALCLSGSAFAQVPSRGACPCVTTPSNFKAPKFLGRWYEAERFFTNYELSGKCNTVDYSPGVNSTTFNRTETFISPFSGKVQTYHTVSRVPDPKRYPAKSVTNFPKSPSGALFNKWVVGTDYKSYAVVWGCTKFGPLNVQFSWILTRSRNPEKSVMNKAYKVIKNKKINRSYYFKVDQEDCDDVDDDDDVADDDVDTIRFVS